MKEVELTELDIINLVSNTFKMKNTKLVKISSTINHGNVFLFKGHVPLKESKLKIGDKVYYRDCVRPFTVSNLGSKGFETVNYLGLVSGSDDVLDYSLTIQ